MIKNLILTLFILAGGGCTIHLQIDTDFAAQSDGKGLINEEVTTEASASASPVITADVSNEGI